MITAKESRSDVATIRTAEGRKRIVGFFSFSMVSQLLDFGKRKRVNHNN